MVYPMTIYFDCSGLELNQITKFVPWEIPCTNKNIEFVMGYPMNTYGISRNKLKHIELFVGYPMENIYVLNLFIGYPIHFHGISNMFPWDIP